MSHSSLRCEPCMITASALLLDATLTLIINCSHIVQDPNPIPIPIPRIPFPYLVLLVSGGHCILGVVHGPGSFTRLGSTKDDAPGEAFDKVARTLGLNSLPETSSMPGGAAVEHVARRGNPSKFPLPDIMLPRLVTVIFCTYICEYMFEFDMCFCSLVDVAISRFLD